MLEKKGVHIKFSSQRSRVRLTRKRLVFINEFYEIHIPQIILKRALEERGLSGVHLKKMFQSNANSSASVHLRVIIKVENSLATRKNPICI